jgi:putative transposase
MAQSLAKLLVHMTFSTKGRYPFLTPAVQPELHAYVAAVLKSCESPAVIVNSVADHVHVLCLLSKRWAVCDVIERVKTGTSKWIKTKANDLRAFHWQNGYGAFSVSQSQVAGVTEYIAGQKEHHRRMTFEEELRALLRRHEMEFDEQYVWD